MNLNSATWVAEHVAGALQTVVETMISMRPEVSWDVGDGAVAAANTNDFVWWAQQFSELPSPAMWLGATDATINTLGQALLSSLGLEDSSPEDSRSTCQDLFAQAANGLAQGLTERLGRQVTAGETMLAAPPLMAPAGALLLRLAGTQQAANLTVCLNPEFLASFADGPDTLSESDVTPSGRIADLELCVHATLGRTTILLQDVFKLTVGSVIDIGKNITDPVDLVVNNETIARGQVVVYKASYGVRVAEQIPAAGGIKWQDIN